MMEDFSVSVCMATYNGEKYIKSQISSILKQLSPNDEIIISDDGSTDDTKNIIENFNDRRIKFYKNPHKGIISNFENALRHAQNHLIFLSDQDDLWYDDKVVKIKNKFLSDNSLTMVYSNASIIDGSSKPTGELFFNKIPQSNVFWKQFLKSSFLGCTMCFKNQMLNYILPIPHHIPMHDWWIGLLNIKYGKVGFINEPLIYYRRHGNNATSDKHASIPQMLKWRITLFNAIRKR